MEFLIRKEMDGLCGELGQCRGGVLYKAGQGKVTRMDALATRLMAARRHLGGMIWDFGGPKS